MRLSLIFVISAAFLFSVPGGLALAQTVSQPSY